MADICVLQRSTKDLKDAYNIVQLKDCDNHSDSSPSYSDLGNLRLDALEVSHNVESIHLSGDDAFQNKAPAQAWAWF
ncbi:hypothetical protein QQX98_012934, partial [Neonectria punicea]